MLLNSPNNKPSSYNESDIVALIGFKRYAEAYSLLERSKVDTIAHHYNMAICLYKGELFSKALQSIDKALSLIDRKMSNYGKLSEENSTIMTLQATLDTHLAPIDSQYTDSLGLFTMHNAVRIKVDCLVQLHMWEEVLKTSKRIETYNYNNIKIATSLAQRNLTHGRL